MADQAITPVALGLNAASAAITPASLTAANDGVITPTSENMAIILTDTGGAGGTVLVKAGADSLKKLQGDISVTLGASETKAIYVESARCKALSGTDKGKIRLDASANTSAYAVLLP
jgi:hypothetical protein